MPSCIEAMEEVLASLARGELYNPLRSIARPEGADTLLGLMPSYRVARRLRTAQGDRGRARRPLARPGHAHGRRPPARRRHRGAARDHERIADHRDPDGCRVRRRDARARATGCAASRDSRRGSAGSRPRPRDACRSRRSGDPDLGAPARAAEDSRATSERRSPRPSTPRSSAPRSCARRQRPSSRSSRSAGSPAAPT